MPFTLCANVTDGDPKDYAWEETIFYQEDITILLSQPRAEGLRCVLREFEGKTGLAMLATDNNGDTLEEPKNLVAMACPPQNHQGGQWLP